MSDVTNRREILKAVASLPFALAAAPFKLLLPAPTTDFRGGLIAKFSASQLSCPGSYLSFQMRAPQLGAPAGQEAVLGYATQLPSGEVVAFSSAGPVEGCTFDYLDCAKRCQSEFNVATSGPALVCRCHGNVFDIHGNRLIAGAQQAEPVRLRVKRCHDTLCIIAGQSDGLS